MKSFGCCMKPKDTSFCVLCLGTIEPSAVIISDNHGAENAVSRVNLDECCLVLRHSDSLEKFTKKQILAAHAIVFLVNSAASKSNVEQQAQVLRKVHEHPSLFGTPCLLFATHQDQNTAFSCDQLETMLDLSAIRASRCLLIHCCSGGESSALMPGFNQLANELLKRRRTGSGKRGKARHSFNELTSKALDNLGYRSKSRTVHTQRSAEDSNANAHSMKPGDTVMQGGRVLPIS